MILGWQRQEGADIPLEGKDWGVFHRDRSRLHAAGDERGVDPVLEIICIGEIVETIFDIGFRKERRSQQSHGKQRQ